ncbi:cysteine dioxygenase family protein [Caballeronia sp. LP006]|uniref:cysteine dioxygenase family protein n=1 Tax=unclassified Caballeronia TaxID=2646786 RepID=UPI00285CC827|nr:MULTISPECIES: cysteine dioxygenase family protein [unclassified Caballeronia]MDR5802390.1 cysteine dioxygenase family protein [Caballeronia sp. LZ001]MDR5830827.1 cysteine dioxygenase family protein [Caballeronia sp. LP006]
MKFEAFSRLSRPRDQAPASLRGGSALNRLCDEIDAAFHSADALSFGSRVRAALRRASSDTSLLRLDQRESGARGYRRHLLAADPLDRYAIAALVWEPGQASPVHGHRTWCGYAVIDGTLEETLYRWDAPSASAIETRHHAREAGDVSFVQAGRGAIHRLGNPADATARAISLHIYGVAGDEIATHVNDLLAA